jgi:hypothetical protein
VGKDETRGLRGWSGSRAAADVAIECRIEREDDKVRESPVKRRYVWFEKAKDGPCGFTLADYYLRNVEIGKKPSGQPDTTCWVEYAEPPPPPTGSSVADEIAAKARERQREEAFTERMLDAIVEHLIDSWTSRYVVADRLKIQAGFLLGREKMASRLRVLASDMPDDVVTIERPGGKIEIRTRPNGKSSPFIDFRVIRKTSADRGASEDDGAVGAENSDEELSTGAEHGH